MKKIIIFGLFFVLTIHHSVIAEVTIKAEIDKTSVTTDEVVAYKILITSDSQTRPVLEIPKFEGFKVLSQAHSTTINFTKVGAKNLNVYAFILLPLRIGKLKIEPSKLKVGDTNLFSESFEIEVKEGKQKPIAPKEEKPPAKKGIKTNSNQITL
jgi:hypothetical protein